jgi:hypothetical protein
LNILLTVHEPHIEPLKEKPPDGVFSSGNSSTRAPHPPVPPPVPIAKPVIDPIADAII